MNQSEVIKRFADAYHDSAKFRGCLENVVNADILFGDLKRSLKPDILYELRKYFDGKDGSSYLPMDFSAFTSSSLPAVQFERIIYDTFLLFDHIDDGKPTMKGTAELLNNGNGYYDYPDEDKCLELLSALFTRSFGFADGCFKLLSKYIENIGKYRFSDIYVGDVNTYGFETKKGSSFKILSNSGSYSANSGSYSANGGSVDTTDVDLVVKNAVAKMFIEAFCTNAIDSLDLLHRIPEDIKIYGRFDKYFDSLVNPAWCSRLKTVFINASNSSELELDSIDKMARFLFEERRYKING